MQQAALIEQDEDYGHLGGPYLAFEAPVKPVVRTAAPTDRPAIRAMLDRLYIDNPPPGNLPVSPQRILDHINGATSDRGIIGLIEQDGALAASVGIFPFQPWYSDEWVLSVFWLYVEPWARPALPLFDALCDFAKAHRAEMERLTGRRFELDFDFISRSRLKARDRLWSRHGKRIGSIYLMDREG